MEKPDIFFKICSCVVTGSWKVLVQHKYRIDVRILCEGVMLKLENCVKYLGGFFESNEALPVMNIAVLDIKEMSANGTQVISLSHLRRIDVVGTKNID